MTNPQKAHPSPRPPLGLVSRRQIDEWRLDEIRKAMGRYTAALLPIPPEWGAEWNEIVERLKAHGNSRY